MEEVVVVNKVRGKFERTPSYVCSLQLNLLSGNFSKRDVFILSWIKDQVAKANRELKEADIRDRNVVRLHHRGPRRRYARDVDFKNSTHTDVYVSLRRH